MAPLIKPVCHLLYTLLHIYEHMLPLNCFNNVFDSSNLRSVGSAYTGIGVLVSTNKPSRLYYLLTKAQKCWKYTGKSPPKNTVEAIGNTALFPRRLGSPFHPVHRWLQLKCHRLSRPIRLHYIVELLAITLLKFIVHLSMGKHICDPSLWKPHLARNFKPAVNQNKQRSSSPGTSLVSSG